MATPTTKVEWRGLREANRALKKLPDFAKKEVQLAMTETAANIARAASARARHRTGRLQLGIASAARPRSLSAVVGVSRDAFYWKFLEYGTVSIPARPFMRPAAVAEEKPHENRMLAALERALQRVPNEPGVIKA
jgi:HK97 gp10 family phage protein